MCWEAAESQPTPDVDSDYLSQHLARPPDSTKGPEMGSEKFLSWRSKTRASYEHPTPPWGEDFSGKGHKHCTNHTLPKRNERPRTPQQEDYCCACYGPTSQHIRRREGSLHRAPSSPTICTSLGQALPFPFALLPELCLPKPGSMALACSLSKRKRILTCF